MTKKKIKSLLTKWQKEKCEQYSKCEDCPEFEKHYGGICCYAYFNEIKEPKDND